MTQQEVLQNLFQVRTDLENRLMDLSPGGDAAQVQAYQDLRRRRDQVFMTINHVIKAEFDQAVNPKLDELLQSLAAEAASLQKLANTFQNVNRVLSAVDDVIKIVQQVVVTAASLGLSRT
jgi:hypothetical protein